MYNVYAPKQCFGSKKCIEQKSDLKIKLYIETRPEGINEKSIELLKKLKVDGVGMGVELASEDFRKNELNRFASQSKTIEAFNLLKKHNIKRTSYNVIGFPNQGEDSILQTIEFNKILNERARNVLGTGYKIIDLNVQFQI